jgi:hypothetical protein
MLTKVQRSRRDVFLQFEVDLRTPVHTREIAL